MGRMVKIAGGSPAQDVIDALSFLGKNLSADAVTDVTIEVELPDLLELITDDEIADAYDARDLGDAPAAEDEPESSNIDDLIDGIRCLVAGRYDEAMALFSRQDDLINSDRIELEAIVREARVRAK